MPIAIRSDKINLSSEKKTEDLAGKFLKKIKPGDIIFVYGEMGVGKTTFIRFLINGLQKRNNLKITEVTSPTFNILNQYEINQFKVNHYDLFRIKSSEEIKNLDLFDDIMNSILLIEWPQIIKKNSDSIIKLSFEYDNNYQNRYIKIID